MGPLPKLPVKVARLLGPKQSSNPASTREISWLLTVTCCSPMGRGVTVRERKVGA